MLNNIISAVLDKMICSLPEDAMLFSVGVKNRADLPDSAFAVIDTSKVTKKDEAGRSKPDTARHLPHHTSKVEDGGENSTVDKMLLRNALARMNQISASEELKKKARLHLVAHARKLLPSTKFNER